ncbi:MAG: hypothetical protein J6R71_09170, partial [Bacteroidales bacterium]|nr:hypothetical protein [Bacteroidales bacterium]
YFYGFCLLLIMCNFGREMRESNFGRKLRESNFGREMRESNFGRKLSETKTRIRKIKRVMN